MGGIRYCVKCKIGKEIENFGYDKSTKDGKNVYCKKCLSKRQKKLRSSSTYKEKAKLKRRAHYLKNKSKEIEYAETWSKRNPDEARFTKFKSNLKKNYKLTLNDLNKMWSDQDGYCIICGYELIPGRDKNCTHIHHCHESNEILGLAHRECNIGFGLFDDDINFLKLIIENLERNE